MLKELSGYSSDELTADDLVSTCRSKDSLRRVGFHVDAGGNVLCHVSHRPFSLTKRDKKKSWWTRKDLNATREKAMTVIKFVVKFGEAYKEAAQQILSNLDGTNLSFKNAPSKKERTDEEALEILSTCKARGLERPLLRLMGVSCPHACVSRLLKLQCRLLQDGCRQSELVEVLAREYQKDSQAATAWARWLAEGDAIFTGNGTKVMYLV